MNEERPKTQAEAVAELHAAAKRVSDQLYVAWKPIFERVAQAFTELTRVISVNVIAAMTTFANLFTLQDREEFLRRVAIECAGITEVDIRYVYVETNSIRTWNRRTIDLNPYL